MAEIDVHTDTHTRTEHWQRIYDSNDDGIAFNPPSFSVNVFLLWGGHLYSILSAFD